MKLPRKASALNAVGTLQWIPRVQGYHSLSENSVISFAGRLRNYSRIGSQKITPPCIFKKSGGYSTSLYTYYAYTYYGLITHYAKLTV